jgi:diguanylate cyclase (GGDEF)-like protein
MRSRWRQAFVVLTAAVVVSGVASVAGILVLNDTYRTSAVRIEREATVSAQLRKDLVAAAIPIASTIPSAEQQQQAADAVSSIRARFVEENDAMESSAARALLAQSLAQLDVLLAAAGSPGHPAAAAIRAGAVTTIIPQMSALIDQAGAVNRIAVRAELANAERHDREALVALALLQLFALALAVRLGRRLSTDVLLPVGLLRDSANQLANGELDHRIVIARDDELGELAVSFNEMANAIAGNQRELSQEARTDSLSGLANRVAFHECLASTLATTNRRSGTEAMLFVDLDDFKDVNDNLGHAAGDELLRVVAHRLLAAVRPGDLVARLGGDEFAILLGNVSNSGYASEVAERVVLALADPVEIRTHQIHVSASVGLAMRQHNSTVDGWVREADVAMYAAKAKGKNRVERYDAELDETVTARQLLKAEVATSAERGELVVEYQPVVDLDTGALVGLEALVRWQHPTRGLLPPSEFIGLAEESGSILQIGAWVLDTAVREVRSWQRRYARPDLWLSVNVSVSQLQTPGCADQILTNLNAAGFAPTNLVIEVTESVLADPAGGAAATLAALRLTGVRVALDDFGTGYSSIGYLRQLPVDSIKIDRSFVAGASPGALGNPLLEAIVGMAQRLDLEIIPEGIEQPVELAHLRLIGCHLGQGFLISRPVPSSLVETLLATPAPFPHIALAGAAVPGLSRS